MATQQNSEGIMSSISAALESKQTPVNRVVDWTTIQDRCVFPVRGGAPSDLDVRFSMNTVLRSTRNATTKKAVLRRFKQQQLSFEGTREIPVTELDMLAYDASEAKKQLVKSICDLFESNGRVIPKEFAALNRPDLDDRVEGVVEVKSPFPVLPSEEPVPSVSRPSRIIGKGKKTIVQISAEEEFQKKYRAIRDSLEATERYISLIDKTQRNYENTLMSRRKREWDTLAQETRDTYGGIHEYPTTCDDYAPLPKLVSFVPGLTITYFSSKDIPEHHYAYLTRFYDQHLMDRGLWSAPVEAVDEQGKPRPLSDRAQSHLIKFSQRRNVASFNKEEMSMQAWRWLIISYNALAPRNDKVALDKRLAFKYERGPMKQGQSVKPAEPPISSEKLVSGIVSALTQKLKERAPEEPPVDKYLKVEDVDSFLTFTSSLLKGLTKSWVNWPEDGSDHSPILADKPPTEWAVQLTNGLNNWRVQAGKLMSGQEFPLLSEPSLHALEESISSSLLEQQPQEEQPIEADAVSTTPAQGQETEGLQPSVSDTLPDDIKEGGKTYFLSDMSAIDALVADGQPVDYIKRFGCIYLNFITEAGDVIAADIDVSKSKGKGKATSPPVSGPPKTPKGAGVTPKSETKGSGKPLTVEDSNPLRVKGKPASAGLTDAQRTSLRRFFKLKDELIPQETWASLSPQERAQSNKARSIPRWAVRHVLNHPSNLEKILSGQLTAEQQTFAATQGTPSQKAPRAQSQASEAWTKLRDSFPGVVLYSRPRTAKEKALKKRFDQLREEFGDQNCFPRLRERPDQQGRPPSKGGNTGSKSQLEDFVSLAKVLGEITKAFRP